MTDVLIPEQKASTRQSRYYDKRKPFLDLYKIKDPMLGIQRFLELLYNKKIVFSEDDKIKLYYIIAPHL